MTTKERLLALLEEGRDRYISGEEIAKALQVSRAAVWKAVQALRAEGYPVDAGTNKGYRLSQACDILSAQGVGKYLKPEYRNLEVTVLPTVPSTNARVRQLASEGAEEGRVVIAREQTAGRGRMGRTFFSPPDTGLYLSLLLRPTEWSARQAACLTAAAAVAMGRAMEQVTGQTPGIKWVNDLFLRGRKVCGILTEASLGLETGVLESMVVGVGVNLYPPEGGFPKELDAIAGSLLERPLPDGKNRLAGAFLNAFWDFYTHPEEKAYLEDYRRWNLAVGREITVLSGGREERAYAQGIDDDCRLLVRCESGETKALSYGEITVCLPREDK
ncbi:MAG: biotin--[acetyl-CoA-carboxylase] ligase [Firmicutes bacterium]|nr:biotin--[acetyl-CoA-carboxylase] ligase [Bacillota bacterium]